jgi:hypothetical protein
MQTCSDILYLTNKAVLLSACDAFTFILNYYANFREETAHNHRTAGELITHVIRSEKERIACDNIDCDVISNMYANAKKRKELAVDYVVTRIFKRIFDHFDELYAEVLSNSTCSKDAILEILHAIDDKKVTQLRLNKVLEAIR